MTTESLIVYPSDFPVKILGLNSPEFKSAVLAVVQRHAQDFDGDQMECRQSQADKYQSITCTVRATSRMQLDALYQELFNHPLVKMVL